MIRLSKEQKPEILAKNQQRWTDDLLEILRKGGDDKAAAYGRYRHADIKTAIVAETHGKCAYCESKILSVTFGDIEHIQPKHSNPELAFDWSNLTLACDVCNTNKGESDDLIDPYFDEPSAEFGFFGPLIVQEVGHQKAERTIAVLKLNRIALLERRKERLERVYSLIERLKAVAELNHREFLRSQVCETETGADQEFAGCVRSFVERLQHLLAGA